jgi:CBS domain-containing protein
MDNDVTVRGVITREYVGVSESDTVRDTVRVMREDQVSSVIVQRGAETVGIVTEWDVLGLVADGSDPDGTPVAEVMSSPVRSVDVDTPLVDAAGIMSSEAIRNLLVVDEATGETVGVLTDRDVIAAVASLQKRSTGEFDPTGTVDDLGGGADASGAVRDRREATAGATAAGGPEGNGEPDPYVSQGVCEVCGSLTDDLREVNGQLVCPNCQEV